MAGSNVLTLFQGNFNVSKGKMPGPPGASMPAAYKIEVNIPGSGGRKTTYVEIGSSKESKLAAKAKVAGFATAMAKGRKMSQLVGRAALSQAKDMFSRFKRGGAGSITRQLKQLQRKGKRGDTLANDILWALGEMVARYREQVGPINPIELMGQAPGYLVAADGELSGFDPADIAKGAGNVFKAMTPALQQLPIVGPAIQAGNQLMAAATDDKNPKKALGARQKIAALKRAAANGDKKAQEAMETLRRVNKAGKNIKARRAARRRRRIKRRRARFGPFGFKGPKPQSCAC